MRWRWRERRRSCVQKRFLGRHPGLPIYCAMTFSFGPYLRLCLTSFVRCGFGRTHATASLVAGDGGRQHLRTPAVGVHSSTKCFKTTRREGTAAPSACSSPCLRPTLALSASESPPPCHSRCPKRDVCVSCGGVWSTSTSNWCAYRDAGSNELLPPT